MEVGIREVRKKSRRVKWEVKPINLPGPRLIFWRTGKYSITRETIIKMGIDVEKYGAVTRQLTFYRIRKHKT